MIKTYKYADGGKVVKDHLAPRPSSNVKLPGKDTRRVPPTPLPKPKIKRYADGGKVASKPMSKKTTKPASAADALRNQRARQMKSLGLKDGGAVRSKR